LTEGVPDHFTIAASISGEVIASSLTCPRVGFTRSRQATSYPRAVAGRTEAAIAGQWRSC
jgi:hypothetical protein